MTDLGVVETLKKAPNEGTDAPYWLILDPQQNMCADVFALANQITGPFFCREDAEEHLKSRRYAFGSKAVVYCHSGYWSKKYRNFWREAVNSEG